MPLLRKLATIAAAGEAARRYAKKNPDKTAKYLDQAASFVDKQTKGRYTTKIDGDTQKVKGVTGVNSSPGAHSAAANGYPQSATAPRPATAPAAPPPAPRPAPGPPRPRPPPAARLGPARPDDADHQAGGAGHEAGGRPH